MLGRYTTGPVAARAEHSRGTSGLSPCQWRPASVEPGDSDPPVYSAPMPRIDLRSDTVTHPSPAMRRAMAEAELGDDVFGDDPTVNALEERAAELLGKEAGLFVASGTMGNLVAQMAHLARGQETIAGREHHHRHRRGRRSRGHRRGEHPCARGPARRHDRPRRDRRRLPRPIGPARADHRPGHHREHARPLDGPAAHRRVHPRRSRAIAPTRTASRSTSTAPGSGTRSSPWASAPTDLADPADTVTFCLSKALACPVGSVVVGPRDFIWRARRARKMVGGGMRQAGVLAAAGLVALSDGPDGMIDRLAEDHANARRLAEALSGMDGIVAAGGTAQPAPRPAGPRRACARTSSCSRSSAIGRPSWPRSERATSRWWNIPTGRYVP